MPERLPDAPPKPRRAGAPTGRAEGVTAVAELFQGEGALALKCSLAALATWAVTLAPLCLARQAPPLLRVGAAVAVLPAVLGPRFMERRHATARHIGISLYCGLALAVWLGAGISDTLVAVSPFRAMTGALAWGVFAIAWSHPWTVPHHKLRHAPAGDTRGLMPRRQLPVASMLVVGVGAALAALTLALAWRVTGRDRAVWAHSIAVAAAAAQIVIGSQVAVVLSRVSRAKGFPLDGKVARWLLASAVLVAAAIWFSQT